MNERDDKYDAVSAAEWQRLVEVARKEGFEAGRLSVLSAEQCRRPLQQQADAWVEICGVLDEVCPDWESGPGKHLVARASHAIKSLVSATRNGWKRGDQRVVCAAIRDANGRIVTGARHYDPVMMEQIKRDLDGMSWRAAEQGFIDQFGKFLTREEARQIAERQGQILDPNGGGPVSLYSENLY